MILNLKEKILKIIVLTCFALLCFTCSSTKDSSQNLQAPIILLKPIEFTMKQRSRVPLPGAKANIFIEVGDINRSKAPVSLYWNEMTRPQLTQTLRKNEEMLFTIHQHSYILKVKDFDEYLLGEDKVSFVLMSAENKPTENKSTAVMSEEDKIEKLILSLQKLESKKVRFLRNGKEYTVQEAIDHMKSKWNWKKSEIKSADDFINTIATKSSQSGEAYYIIFPNGEKQNFASCGKLCIIFLSHTLFHYCLFAP